MGAEYSLTVTCDKCGKKLSYKSTNLNGKKELPSIDVVRWEGWKFIINLTEIQNDNPIKHKALCPICAKLK